MKIYKRIQKNLREFERIRTNANIIRENPTECKNIREESERMLQNPTILREDRRESKKIHEKTRSTKESTRIRESPKKIKIQENIKEFIQISRRLLRIRKNPTKF